MKMKSVLLLVFIYTFAMAAAQIFLKFGMQEMGALKVKGIKDVVWLVINIFKNKAIVSGMALMVSSFILWLYVLSWSKLSLVFPLTAFMYIFVAVFAYFFLGEKLAAYNYLGIVLIVSGVFFLLYR